MSTSSVRREGAFVPVAVGFGDELSLADGDGEPDPSWLDDVLGVGVGGLIVPIPGEAGRAEGFGLVQLGEAEDPPNGKTPPTGALLCVFTLPDPPLPPPPEPAFPPDELAELALLGKIACWASRATYAPAATMETVTPSAASGRSQLRVRAARPPRPPEVGPNRSQATRAALASHSDADWNAAGRAQDYVSPDRLGPGQRQRPRSAKTPLNALQPIAAGLDAVSGRVQCPAQDRLALTKRAHTSRSRTVRSDCIALAV